MSTICLFLFRNRVVPAGLAFGVTHRSSGENKSQSTPKWVLPEESGDAGGLDEKGNCRRRRFTGAVTVDQDSGVYFLQFRLLPGSLPTDIQYRVALVPPAHDPPMWLMQENEVGTLQNATDQSARSLSCVLFIAGLVQSEHPPQSPGLFADQFAKTVSALNKFNIEAFALRWESQQLHGLAIAMQRLMASVAMSVAAQQGARMIVPALVGAIALPLSFVSTLRAMIDNVWATTLSRARATGYMLAAELAARSFGKRPIVLAGYSCGALVIFSCLEELARRNLEGIVHDVFLIGSPCTSDSKKWRAIRKVISGRLVNAYLPGDWYLELFHRTAGGENLISVAGTGPIRDEDANVENYDLTELDISSHRDYATRANEILLLLGLGDSERRRPWMIPLRDPSNAHNGELVGVIEDNERTTSLPGVPQSPLATHVVEEGDDVVAFEAKDIQSSGHPRFFRRKNSKIEQGVSQKKSLLTQ